MDPGACGDQEGEDTMILELLTHNVKQMIKDLPPNSPIRRPLVFRLSRGMTTRTAGSVLGISHTMVSHARNSSPKDDWIVNLRYAPGVTCDQWNEQAVDLFYEVMDEMVPHVSGREFREQVASNRQIYQL